MIAREKIHDAVHALIDESHVTSYPIPVEQIAVAQSIQVVRAKANWTEAGFLLRDGERTILGLNSRHSSQRQRFIIAHVLGHWSFHHQVPLIVDHSVSLPNQHGRIASNASDTQEIEANRFGVELLMPNRFVVDALSTMMTVGVGSRADLIAGLAAQFEVSPDAMSCQLINLGALSH